MKHRLLAGALALALALVPASAERWAPDAALPAVAEEAAAPAVWDGTADTAWYTAEHTTKMVNDTEWAYYEISTAEELAGLSKLVRSGYNMENTYIQLTSDIVLNDTSDLANWAEKPPANEWTAIGAVPYQSPYFKPLLSTCCKVTEFAGMFNGNGHTISGLYCKHDCRAGLFACVSGGVFRTVVKDSYVECVTPPSSWDAYAGGITADCAQGVINQCEFDGTVIANHTAGIEYGIHSSAAGGIVGNFQDKEPLAMIFTMFTIAALGIMINPMLLMAAEPSNPIASPGIYNCVNHGRVQAIDGTGGGILGYANWSLTVRNCYSDGEITSSKNMAGAIAGREYNYPITNCYYENAENSSVLENGLSSVHYQDDSVNLTASGMTREEAAEKLGVFHECRDGEIHLNFFPELPAEPTEPTEASTEETASPTTEATESATTEPAETLPPIELAAPYLTLPDDVTCETTSVAIRWGGVENASYYQIQLAADDDFTDCAINVYQSGDHDRITYLHSGRTYHFRVRAVAKRDEDETNWYSEWTYADLTIPAPAGETEPVTETTEPVTETTEPVTETTEPVTETTEPVTETTEPSAPAVTLVAPCVSCCPELQEDGSRSEYISWTAIDHVTGYQYQAARDADFTDLIADQKSDVAALRITHITSGTTYYFRVRSYQETADGTVYSAYTQIQFTGAADAETAPALSAPVIIGVRFLSEDSARFWWEQSEGASAYELDLALDSDFSQIEFTDTIAASERETMSYSYIELEKDKLYYARIRAKADDGRSSDNTVFSFVVPADFRILYGDADSDQKVDASDAAYILIDAAAVGAGETSSLTDMQRMAADVNADGIIDAADAAAVLQYAAAAGAGERDKTARDFV